MSHTRLAQNLDLFGEDSWRRIHAGDLEVRPPGALTTEPAPDDSATVKPLAAGLDSEKPSRADPLQNLATDHAFRAARFSRQSEATKRKLTRDGDFPSGSAPRGSQSAKVSRIR